MRMRWLDGVVFGYGVILILGGIDGLLHGSKISLIAGGTSGVLEIIFAAMAGSNPRVSRIGSAVIALLIAGKFVPDAIKKHSNAAIVLAACSVLVFALLMGGHFYAMSKRKANA